MKNKNNISTQQITVNSKTEHLTEIRNFVKATAETAGLNLSVIENIILAVDEACTNIIKHAYKSIPDGKIIINIEYDDSQFVIEIIDYGMSFNPQGIPDPDLKAYYKQHRVGGLGMYLMKRLMDEVDYNSIPGKYNQVRLLKYIDASVA